MFGLVLGIDLEKVYLCMGDTEGDVENPVLKAEQESQVLSLYES